MQAPVFPSRDTTPQIIKIGISKDLQLCVEGGFSQIQSHLYNAAMKCKRSYIVYDIQRFKNYAKVLWRH